MISALVSAILLGLIQGAVIGLVALGIVLVYKGSRVFNFAQAELGTVAAFFLYFLIDVVNIPYLVALPLALVGIGIVGFLMERLIVRPLFDAPRVTLLVATAGVTLLFIALELIIGHTQTRILAKAADGTAFSILTVSFTFQRMIVIAAVVGLAIASAWFFKKTDLGLAVLATSQEPVATELVGIGTRRISSFVWVSAAVLGGIAGVLQGPDTLLYPAMMTREFLLLGLTAAVLGGITSLSGAFAGGLLIGGLNGLGSWAQGQFASVGKVPAFPEVLVFVVLLAVLSVRPRGLFGAEA